ncbi:hypothetical protein FEFB_09480 [Fructobacillus sp. EFB-N1]|uniref:hypothetical protein n=1 Tax=Fructobacillus sp. EFB-N1 TaxID=1658766 RepID=UPI00064D965F|nr:hypothetical protein [Fructobacillus sp. EFB-N1]KMK53278.1 hypothetical protein FEFB_09480 [Fructobacillus sp. EFB-N1]
MTLMQFNDALMTVIAVGVVTLSCLAIKYYKQAPLFDEYDIEKDVTNNIVHQSKRLAKRDLKRAKKARLAEQA